MNNLLEGLNDQQKEAVTTTEGYVRVIAGAGSGKTKALTSRYAYIVDALGISSSNILCVTFTNKAAQEMKSRVKRIIGPDADLSYITTYHGFCVRALREDIHKIHYPMNFIIMDVEDQKTILRQVFAELNLNSKDYTFKQVLRYISKEKADGSYLDYILSPKSETTQNPLDKIFYRYLEKQQRNFALDFDDLMNFALYIFDTFPDILDKWQRRLHYIQVDETQDSSDRQFYLADLLSRHHKNLFVVGDPDQTIYEWRGAKPEILVGFDQKFTGVKTIIMNQNYRSTPNILDLGNHIIKKNKIRVDKDMFTESARGIEVVHFHANNDFEEGRWIVNEIKSRRESGEAKYQDFAILYRAHHISRNIEQSFMRENIPYSIFGGIRFFERREIKDALAFLRLIEFEDDLSFLRVINRPSRGLGKKFLDRLSRLAEKDNSSLYSTLINNIKDPELNRKGAKDFINLIERLKSKKDILISDLLKEVLEESGLTASLRLDGDMDRLENIKELQHSIILKENEQEEKISLMEYLQDIALYTDMDLADDAYDKVKLMTIHTSKGLEFPYVFLCGFTEGVLPSAMSLKERREKALEEERRLAYVAITRAEKGFFMTEAEGFNFVSSMNKYPSRFLLEINDKYFVRQGSLNEQILTAAKRFIEYGAQKKNVGSYFQEGDLVYHQVWKDGKILEVNNDKGEYQIEFSESKTIKPIRFMFTGLRKIPETVSLSLDEKKEKEQAAQDWNTFVESMKPDGEASRIG